MSLIGGHNVFCLRSYHDHPESSAFFKIQGYRMCTEGAMVQLCFR